MKTGNTTRSVVTYTVNVESDLSDLRNKFVSLGVDNVVSALADAASVPFILLEGIDGSGLNTVDAVDTIAISGVVEVKLGGTVTVGDKLTATTGSLAIATTTNTDNYGAIALESGVVDDKIMVLVTQGMISS